MDNYLLEREREKERECVYDNILYMQFFFFVYFQEELDVDKLYRDVLFSFLFEKKWQIYCSKIQVQI